MKSQIPPHPFFSPDPGGGPKGTVFRVIGGANLFKRDDMGQQLWREKFGQGMARPSRTRPRNAEELLNVVKLRLEKISPPENRGQAKVWINHDQTWEKKMSGAVTLGEEGQREDLLLLQGLLKDHREEIRACAIQGMSRLCERFPPPESGEVLLQTFLDPGIAVRDLASELLLGHGWLRAWLMANPSQISPQSQQKKQRSLCNVVEYILRSNRYAAGEKETILQKFKAELGEELVSSCLIPAIRLSCIAAEEQILTCQRASQLLKDDPLAGYGVRVQHSQIKIQRSFLAFLDRALAKLQESG